MGLIEAITGSAGGVLADQWKEFCYCGSIANDILIVKGQKRISGRSSNIKRLQSKKNRTAPVLHRHISRAPAPQSAAVAENSKGCHGRSIA